MTHKASFSSILLAIGFLLSSISYSQNALSFDGTDDEIDCGNNASVQITSNQLTLEAWIKPDVWTANVWQGNIINKEQQGSGVDYGYMLRCGNNGSANFNIGDGGWNELTTAQNTLTLNTWQHLAATYDGSYMRIYVNGAIVDSIARNITIGNASSKLFIGSNGTQPRFFSGLIDEVRIWDIARTKRDIQQTMNGEFCGSIPQGLVAYYRFNQGTAGGNNAGLTNLIDDIGVNNGTLLNFALSGNSSNWVAGSPISIGGNQITSFRDTVCQGETYNFGSQVLTGAGTYNDTLLAANGCDSIIELQLDVLAVDTTVSTLIPGTLTALANNVSYQWYDCNAQAIIPGETSDSYTPSDAGGSFAVIITQNGCSDTSSCYHFSGVGLNEFLDSEIDLFPNPVKDILSLNLYYETGWIVFTLSDISGKTIFRDQKLNHQNINLDFSTLESGIYLLHITTETKSGSFKIIRE